MAAKFRYKADVDNTGKIVKVHGKRGMEQDLKLFSGKSIWIEISKFTKTRSDQQNKFHFGNYIESQIECFQEYWGGVFTKEQVHDWNKANIFCEERLIDDEVIKIPMSSTEQSTTRWEECLEKGRIWFMQQFNWQLPYPETQSEMNF